MSDAGLEVAFAAPIAVAEVLLAGWLITRGFTIGATPQLTRTTYVASGSAPSRESEAQPEGERSMGAREVFAVRRFEA